MLSIGIDPSAAASELPADGPPPPPSAPAKLRSQPSFHHMRKNVSAAIRGVFPKSGRAAAAASPSKGNPEDELAVKVRTDR